MPYDTLNKLAEAGNTNKLEGEWMTAIESSEIDFDALVPVLEKLTKKGHGETAEVLAWSALERAKQRCEVADVLPIAAKMLVPLDNSNDLRQEIGAMYKQVYANIPHIDAIIERSGLADGSKRPRRALRTLDVCVHATPGSFVLSRHDETAARIESADAESDLFELVTADGDHQSLSADELAVEYAPVSENNFHVLEQFRHNELTTLLRDNPGDIAVTIVRSAGGRMSQDDLKFKLTPKYLAHGEWTKWWSRARAGLKKSRNVRMEGRSPVQIIYDEAGQDLEKEAWEQLKRSFRPSEIAATVDTYFRECKAAGQAPKPEFINRLIDDVIGRVDDLRKDHAADAWAAALVVDQLVEQHPESGRDDACHGVEFLQGETDPAALLLALSENKLRPSAVKAVKEILGDKAADAFAAIIRIAPEGLCSPFAKTMIDAGQVDRVTEITREACANPVDSIEMLAWLWKGPKEAAAFEAPPQLELMLRMFDALGHVNRDGDVSADLRNRVRNAIKGALSAERYKRFDACIAELDVSMASTIRTQLNRADGLGNVAPDVLLEIIRKRFPVLWVKPKVDPWDDKNVIYVTAAGLRKHEAAIGQIENVDLVDVGRAIGEAAAHGDLSENSEYRFALERRDMLYSRLNVMKDQHNKARVMAPEDVPTDYVSIGARVTLARVDNGEPAEITLLGPWEADPDSGVYNYLADVCRDMLGKKIGETTHLNLEDESHDYRIVSIAVGL